MPIWTQETGISAKQYVGPTSRYAGSKVRYYTENKILTLETYKRKRRSGSSNDQWLEITSAVEYRPDLVSFEIYGTPDFWWSLLEYNGMKDILEFRTGRNIRVPGNIMYA